MGLGLLKNLPPQFWQIFPLVVYGLFIVSGIGVLVSGILNLQKATDKEDALGFAEAGIKTGGMMSIAMGISDLLMGIVGLVITLLGVRKLQYLLAGILISMVMMNLFTFFALTVNNADDWRETTSTMKKMVKELYGNNSRSDGQKFTDLVNKMQSETPCCGLTSDEKENIFIQTEWYTSYNKDKEKKATLPDSCCTKHVDECRYATDIQKARDDGHVYKADCINELYKSYGRQMVFVFLEVSMSTLMQIIAAVYTVLFLIFGPRDVAQ